ncbi:pre-rRNA processing protein [Thelotrema lepadinum]|nr:pre-rRNA processing protein [Thelotrema lepadinum]
MSSFFTTSISERKKSRAAKASGPPLKRKRVVSSEAAKPRKANKKVRDESISGSDSELETGSEGLASFDDGTSISGSEDENGTERRRRLAERYLENLKEGIDENGFDAADLDRDLIAERLQEDVSESKGKLYRHIATTYDFATAIPVQFRPAATSTTCVAVSVPYVYTANKDMTITQWKLPPDRLNDPPVPEPEPNQVSPKSRGPPRRRPVRVQSTRGTHRPSSKSSLQNHTAPILCLAASSDGRFLASGGADKRLIIWSTETLKPLRVFSQHRDAVLSLAFRHSTNQLYSGSADRTIKTWSLNELAYVETLFGHQDAVIDVAALAQERCLSAGSRDRTVRLWKVVEETQLVFRNGPMAGEMGSSKFKQKAVKATLGPDAGLEGSIERVAFVDDEAFVSGSDNGTISLWSMHKKKPISSISAAHGFDAPPTPEEYYAEVDTTGKVVSSIPLPRWITALAVVPYSDLILSGSWDGYVRVWKVSTDKRRIEPVGHIGATLDGVEVENDGRETSDGEILTSMSQPLPARGVINDIDVFEQGKRGKETLHVIAALGKEHRLGRWKKVKGRNGAVLFEISKRSEGQ